MKNKLKKVQNFWLWSEFQFKWDIVYVFLALGELGFGINAFFFRKTFYSPQEVGALYAALALWIILYLLETWRRRLAEKIGRGKEKMMGEMLDRIQHGLDTMLRKVQSPFEEEKKVEKTTIN